jgi:hypothetical protein
MESQVEGNCGAAKPVDLNHLIPIRQWGLWGTLLLGHAFRSHGSCCRHGGPKSAGSESPEACLLVPGYGGTKPVGSRSSGA